MNFNVLVVQEQSENSELLGFNATFQNSLDCQSKDFDLLVLDAKYYEEKAIKALLDQNIFIIYLLDHKEKLQDLLITNRCSTLYKPYEKSQLLEKIKQFETIHQLTKRITEQDELCEVVLDTASNPMFIASQHAKFIQTNRKFDQLLGIKGAKDANAKFDSIAQVFNEKPDRFFTKGWLEATSFQNLRVSIISSENKERFFILKNSYLKESQSHLIYLEDVTHELEHESALFNLLYTDSNTKLPNRAKLIDQLQNEQLEITALALFDINSFKEINDFYGNRTGDRVLSEVAELMTKMICDREALQLYKFSADIYCLTNTSLSQKDFEKLVQDIIQRVDETVLSFNQSEINTRVTVGISFSEKNNKLITADLALQAAKNSHKDYLTFYEELDNIREYENNMLWTKKVKNALENDEIVVYYQPLINNDTLKVEKYECLVRLKDGDKIVSPFFFLDIAKKSNQYTKITKVVIEKACQAFSNLNFEFSVNISYEDIEDPDFYAFIENVVKQYRVTKQIVFEILEDENVKNYDVLINFIEKVKALGCKVAIDDFGSGYSNFEHILKMNVDYLKIDASLIKNVAVDDNSYKITKTIIDFANSLNLQTIAEFVENREIFDIVSTLNANFSQGYYFSAPLPYPDFNLEAKSE